MSMLDEQTVSMKMSKLVVNDEYDVQCKVNEREAFVEDRSC
jgi:hypothetical protein